MASRSFKCCGGRWTLKYLSRLSNSSMPMPPRGAGERRAIGIREALRARRAKKFGEAGTSAGNVRESVHFAGIQGDVILAGAGRVSEPDFDIVANVFHVTIAPDVEGVDGRGAAALLRRAVVRAASSVRFDFIGRAP